jgi:putative ABC transport system substrate-binding protein
MTRHRYLGVLVGLIIVAGPLAAHAQQAPPARIGFLSFATPTSPYLLEFQKTMAELGHVEGKNLQTLYRNGHGKTEEMPAFAAELVRERVQLIVAHEGPSTQAAMAATSEIPIVVILAVNLPEQGIVSSLARPGGNVTGVDRQMAELGAKRLELLKQMLPAASRFAILADGIANRIQQGTVQKTVQAARTLGVVEARTRDDVERAFGEVLAGRPDALVIESGPVLSGPAAPQLAALTMRHRLPASHARREFADAGGLMSYGPDYLDVYRRAAFFVDKILKGAKPSEMPVERPTRFELILNLKTAKALGVSVPQSIILRADEVIE